ncbi:MAG: hypothetical protein GF421_03110 [Candidatus Aminicenantes bacterium]|nr:hypothetical protein [Candidatus Aminicenantes bacterium]
MMSRENRPEIQWRFLILTLVYLGLVGLFYFRYVPMIPSFQMALLPILGAAFGLTAVRFKWGLLFFVLAFPLINNLPYFFGIYGDVPHAPTALILFLFFFLGWMVNSIFSSSRISLNNPLFKPLFFFSVLIFISALISFFRYSNFFPFLTDHVYELQTNVEGVTAGGAIMSAVFFALNYLSGFALFFIVVNRVRQREFLKKIVVVLLISTCLSIGFGFYQQFGNMEQGNNPISFNQGFINGTFKDAMSFGGYLAVVVPLLLSLVFFFKGVRRIFSLVVFHLAMIILPNTGSRSGLIAFILSLVLFGGLYMFVSRKHGSYSLKKAMIRVAALVLIMAAVLTIVLFFKGAVVSQRLNELWVSYKQGGLDKALAERSSSIWKGAAYMIRDYPLTGVGMGAFIIELPNYAQVHEFSLRTTDSAENYWIQVMAELGIMGLFFALWMFGVLFKQMKQSLTNRLSQDRWKFLQIGISCSIVSMMLIFCVHTFIGSYELKYTFWLLAGMLFISSPPEEKSRPPVLGSRFLLFFSAALITVFTGFQLWNSTHSLSLERQSDVLGLDQSFGFYAIEQTQSGTEFQWSKKRGCLRIRVKEPVLKVPVMASHPDIKQNPVQVKIFLVKDFFREKNMLDQVVLTNSSWETRTFHLPEEVGRQITLLFEVSRTWNPWKMTGALDIRNLGIALGEIKQFPAQGRKNQK